MHYLHSAVCLNDLIHEWSLIIINLSSIILDSSFYLSAKKNEEEQNEGENNNNNGGGGTAPPPNSGAKRKAAETDNADNNADEKKPKAAEEKDDPTENPPPPLIDPSKLEINSRILLKNNDDDDDTPLREATIKKLDLSHDPPKIRVHVDGKRKGILNTIDLEDIHSIIGKRNTKFERKGSAGSGSVYASSGDLTAIERLPQLPPIQDKEVAPPSPQDEDPQEEEDDDDLPIISPQDYHSKFCLPRRKKRLRQLERLASLQQQQQAGVQQFNVPTFGGPGKDLTRRRSSNSEGARMIMEDLLMMQNNNVGGLPSLQQQQQQAGVGMFAQPPGVGMFAQPAGVGMLGYPFQDHFRNSFTTLPFGQGGNPMDVMGGGGGNLAGFGSNSNLLMPPFGTAMGRVNDDATAAAKLGLGASAGPAATNAGQGGSLPQSAFSALDSLAPELREKMLRISKIAGTKDEGYGDSAAIGNDGAAEKKTGEKDKEGSDEDDEKTKAKKKYEPKSTKKGRGKGKRILEKKPSGERPSLVSRDSEGTGAVPGAAAAALGGRRLTDFTAMSGQAALSPTVFKPESFFGMRNSLVDAAAMSYGSASGRSMRNVLGPTGMISGGSDGLGSGMGNVRGQINMMQLMGMNPPPFRRRPLGAGAMGPPFGGGAGGGINSGAALQRQADASSSVDVPVSPPADAEAKNEVMATLESAEKIKKKGKKASSAAAGKTKSSGVKRKDSSSSNKKKSSEKMKKAKKETSPKPIKSAASDKYQKPKRPFSAYNLFFQLEREFIMATLSSGGNACEDPLIKAAMEAVGAANEKEDVKGKGVLVKVDKNKRKELEEEGVIVDFDINEGIPKGTETPPKSITVPPRYKHLKLEDHWYCVSRKVKRKHRKTEGGCGFVELTQMVSSRWKTVESTDPKVKQWCKLVAEQQLVAYKKDVAEYKEWLANRSQPGDDDAIPVDDTEEAQKLPLPPTPIASKPVATIPPVAMGVGASPIVMKSPFDFGKVHQNFFDPRMSDMARMSDMGRFSDLSQPGRKIFNRMMMPNALPPLPLQFSQDITERLNKLGGRPMDETERRFAALAEQESRRQIQTELQMASFVRPPPFASGALASGFGPLGGAMGGLADASGIGGYPSMMPPPMNQGNMGMSNEQMMAQIMMMKNRMANNNGVGLAGGKQLPQKIYGMGGKQVGDDGKSGRDGSNNNR